MEVLLLLLFTPVSTALFGESCREPTPASEVWTLGNGMLSSDGTLCAEVQGNLPLPEGGTLVTMSPCNSSSARQKFSYLSNSTLVLFDQPSHCLNLEDYGNEPGTVAWITYCDSSACKGNCMWTSSTGSNLTSTLLKNSGLCLQDGSTLPPLPHTCEIGSPSYALPFCDYTLPVDSRVSDLLSRFTLDQKVQQWNIGAGGFVYDPVLNVKAFHWDFTCIHGVNYPNGFPRGPSLNVSVFPHAIAQAASWDLDLVTRLSLATLYEARTLNQALYRLSGGETWAGTSCDGGPLANTAHDGRWGRISECYGEDPTLSAAVGVTATRVMQNRSADGHFLGTSQVTRHWLGYHMARPDLPHGGEEQISLHAFADQQAPVYRAFQVDGGAEGIMCAYAAFIIGDEDQPHVPSCVHPYLHAKLFDEWGFDGFQQTDCCDSITSSVDDHHYYSNYSQATVAAIEMGVHAYFGFNGELLSDLRALLDSGDMDQGLFDQRIRTTLRSRFRMGEFDYGRNPAYPYAGPFDEKALDGPEHRALAREAVSASTVLLENYMGWLPMQPSALAGKRVAIIGPFAHCSVRENNGGADRNEPLSCAYGHTYEGVSGDVSTMLTAAQEEATRLNFSLGYVPGSGITTPASNASQGLSAAIALAATSDVNILVLGLGELLETEGLDRSTFLLPQPQEDLLYAVLGAAKGPVVVCLVSAGLVHLNKSSRPPSAVLQLFYPGAETGHGVWDLLLGRVSPSARLPLTAYTEAYLSTQDPIWNFNLMSSQGVGRTYRYLDPAGNGSLVNYWFGYGLSYAHFSYSDLFVEPTTPFPRAGSVPLNTTALSVTFRVTCITGPSIPASEVAQVYISVPRNGTTLGNVPIPYTSLAAFVKTRPLTPGVSQLITLQIPLSALETTTDAGDRVLSVGQYTVAVSGHLPGDAKGPANVVNQRLALPPVELSRTRLS